MILCSKRLDLDHRSISHWYTCTSSILQHHTTSSYTRRSTEGNKLSSFCTIVLLLHLEVTSSGTCMILHYYRHCCIWDYLLVAHISAACVQWCSRKRYRTDAAIKMQDKVTEINYSRNTWILSPIVSLKSSNCLPPSSRAASSNNSLMFMPPKAVNQQNP